MSTFSIPNSQGQIRQSNSGDIFGELHETFNIDLTTNQGKIKTSNRLGKVLVEGTHIGTPAGFVDMLTWGSYYYILTEDSGYRCSVLDDPTNSSNWASSVATHDSDLSSTAVIFDGQMRISTNTDISRWNGGGSYATDWWTNDESGDALTTSVPHVMEVVQSQKETLYVTDGAQVQYLEKGSTTKVVELDSNVIASCLASGLSGAMWVGTYNETNGNAYVYEIYTGEVTGSTPTYRQAYPINAQAVLAIWMKDNNPHILTEKGEIQAFNGAGFITIEEFPIRFDSKTLEGVQSGQIQSSNRSRPVHPRGVRTHEDSVFFNINLNSEEDEYSVNTRAHSGIWEYNYVTQVLNHRFSPAHQTTDYGSSKTNFGYPLMIVDNQYTFLMSGGFDSVNSLDNVYMTISGTPQSWFVTKEISSGTVADAYEAVYHKAKTLAVGEEIVTQYRTSKRDTVYATANWLTTTSFTTTTDVSAIQDGELIRVSHGYASGDYCNVVSITSSATTWTVTVDRAIGAVGEVSYIYSDNYIKSAAPYTSEQGEYQKLGGFGVNPWIQFLVILKGNIEYRQFISKGNSKTEL